MPHFYIDAIIDGEAMPDPEGIELDNRAVARMEAVRAAAEMVKDRHLVGNARQITVSVREGRGPVVAIRLSLKIEDVA